MAKTERDTSTSAQVSDVVIAGHTGDHDVVEAALGSDDPQIRAAALGATVRLASTSDSFDATTPALGARSSTSTASAAGTITTAAKLRSGLHDIDTSVRRRAAVEIGRWSSADPGPTGSDTEVLATALIECLAAPDEPTVCEVAAFACGELRFTDDSTSVQRDSEDIAAESGGQTGFQTQDHVTTIGTEIRARVVAALSAQATGHEDHLCRESAVAALGSIGDPDGLAAVLAGCEDRATVRRRAVLALAAFDDPLATEALVRLLSDRDLQVRQAAEELLAIEGGEPT